MTSLSSWIKSVSPVNHLLFLSRYTDPFAIGTTELDKNATSGAFWLINKSGRKFPCLWIPFQTSNKVLVYLHGNGCNIMEIQETMLNYSKKLSISVIAICYPGYGPAEGNSCESSIDDCVQTTFTHLTDVLGFHASNIIIMGRSIGTGPAVKLASDLCIAKTPPGALILQSAYTSVLDIVKDMGGLMGFVGSSLMINRWESIKSISKVTCPILFIHGVNDNLIPISHTKNLSSASISSMFVQTYMLQNVDHNSFDDNVHVLPHLSSLVTFLFEKDSPSTIPCSIRLYPLLRL